MQGKDGLTVKDIAELLETEPYVLRFYEKELKLQIERNEKGYRVYYAKDVELFKKILNMRDQGLQLKAIENIIHSVGEEQEETYGQISSIQLAAISDIKPAKMETTDIANGEDQKVKQFSNLMKEMLMQALVEYGQASQDQIRQTIRKQVDEAVEERVSEFISEEEEKSRAYYRKLDETIREMQKLQKELKLSDSDIKKSKGSIWKRLFKGKEEAVDC